jgi:uncharacterized membrane protein
MIRHAVFSAALLTALPMLASAASFTYTTLSVPGQHITSASGTVNAINDSDVVVGGVEDSAFNFQGFVWSGGTFTLYPGAVTLAAINADGLATGYSQALSGYVLVNTKNGKVFTFNNHFDRNPFYAHLYGMNASGSVVAQDEYSRDITAGYIFRGGKKTTLLVHGSFVKYGGTFATAINDSQVVTGSYFAGGMYEHGFIYQNGNFTSFDVPGAAGGTFPYFIGKDGSIAGGYATGVSVPQVGFLLSGGMFTTITPPGVTQSYVAAIGPGGELVGSSWNGTGGHGFIYRGGHYHTIDVPGGTYTTINAVNARGTLVGTYHDAGGNVLSYVAQCAAGVDCVR